MVHRWQRSTGRLVTVVVLPLAVVVGVGQPAEAVAAQGDGDSAAAVLSSNGRFVAFTSSAGNLVAGDTNRTTDIFVRDLALGVVRRISVSTAGGQADGPSYLPSISGDGHVVVFRSYATNLVPGDTNGVSDILVRDLAAGTTVRANSAAGGGQANGDSIFSTVTPDGRQVAFDSTASNLVAGDTNRTSDVFVRDLAAGTVRRVSLGSAGTQSNGHSYHPALSADGSRIAFDSTATNLAPGVTTESWREVYVRDLSTGVTALASGDSTGHPGGAFSGDPSISADGRRVEFASDSARLVPGDTNGYDIFVHDLATGAMRRVTVDSAGGQADGDTVSASISADGTRVIFRSDAANLVPGDTNGAADIFVHDLSSGATSRVSVGDHGQADASSYYAPALSADGRCALFSSSASNLVPNDTNGRDDVFVRDLRAGRTDRISLSNSPHQPTRLACTTPATS